MKRKIFIPFALAFALALSGCGRNSASEPATSEGSASDSSAWEVASSEPTEVEVSSTSRLLYPPDEESLELIPSTISEQVLVDQDGFKITANAGEFIQENNAFSPYIGIPISIENNSAENVTVLVYNLICNGIMVENNAVTEVAAGKKANDEITIPQSELKRAGIGTIGTLEFSFDIYRTDDYETIIYTDPIIIKTSNAETYQQTQTTNTEGTVLLDQNGLKIKCQGILDYTDFSSKDVLLYIENNSPENLNISLENLSVNGFMVGSYDYWYILQGKSTFVYFTLQGQDLEANEITNIELTFEVSDLYSGEPLFTSNPIAMTVKNN